MHIVHCGSGDPILFIHGMPTSGRLWSGIIARLCEHYTCFAIDLPGMGETPGTPYDEHFLRSLAEQVDALRAANGIDKWHVVGHDAGSAIAVHYAHYYPERVACMGLLSPAIFPELRPFFLIEMLRKPILGELLAPLISFLFWKIAMHRALFKHNQDDGVTADFYRPFSGIFGSWRFMRLMRWGKPAAVLADVPGFLPSLSMPILIFHGLHDPAIPAEFATRAASLLPNATIVTLDSGHFIPLCQPEPVAQQLSSFFRTARTRLSTQLRKHDWNLSPNHPPGSPVFRVYSDLR